MAHRITSIAELRAAPGEERARRLDLLVPGELRRRFDLPRHALWDEGADHLQRWVPGPRPGALRVEVWPDPEGIDPALALDLVDLPFGKLEVAWIALSDVAQQRYDVDRDRQGRPFDPGSGQRNRAAEVRALAAGLAPYQARPGLGAFRSLIRCIHAFARRLGVDTLQVVPLAYHNAIQYERYGFTYGSEEVETETIHRQFQPGGALRRRLDGRNPFRRPALADTVRGRSWAIYDGILGQRWMPPPMYKFVERDFDTCTFPAAVW